MRLAAARMSRAGSTCQPGHRGTWAWQPATRVHNVQSDAPRLQKQPRGAEPTARSHQRHARRNRHTVAVLLPVQAAQAWAPRARAGRRPAARGPAPPPLPAATDSPLAQTRHTTSLRHSGVMARSVATLLLVATVLAVCTAPCSGSAAPRRRGLLQAPAASANCSAAEEAALQAAREQVRAQLCAWQPPHVQGCARMTQCVWHAQASRTWASASVSSGPFANITRQQEAVLAGEARGVVPATPAPGEASAAHWAPACLTCTRGCLFLVAVLQSSSRTPC